MLILNKAVGSQPMGFRGQFMSIIIANNTYILNVSLVAFALSLQYHSPAAF